MKVTAIIVFLGAYFSSTALRAQESEQVKLINAYACWKLEGTEQARCYDWLYTHPNFQDNATSIKWKKDRKLGRKEKIDEVPLDTDGKPTLSATLFDEGVPTTGSSPKEGIDIPPKKGIMPPTKIALNTKDDKKYRKSFGPAPKEKSKAKLAEAPLAVDFDADEYDKEMAAKKTVTDAKAASPTIMELDDEGNEIGKPKKMPKPTTRSFYMKKLDMGLVPDEEKDYDTLVGKLKADGCKIEQALKGTSYKGSGAPDAATIAILKDKCFEQFALSDYKNYDLYDSKYKTLQAVFEKDCPIVLEAAEALIGQKSNIYGKNQPWKALKKKTTLEKYCSNEKEMRSWLEGTAAFKDCPKLKAKILTVYREEGAPSSAEEKESYVLICRSEQDVSSTLSGSDDSKSKEVVDAARSATPAKTPPLYKKPGVKAPMVPDASK